MATFYNLLEIADLPGVGDILGPPSSPNMSIDFLETEHTAEVADDALGTDGYVMTPAGFYLGSTHDAVTGQTTIDGATYVTTGLWEVAYDFDGTTYSGYVIEAAPADGTAARYFFMPEDEVDPATFGDVEILTMTAVTFIDESAGDNDDSFSFQVCFAEGTLIATPAEPRPVESLKPGDRVSTLDGAAERVLWAGATHVRAAQATGKTGLRGVVIAPDAFAPGLPVRPLVVSRQHRLLLRSRIARRMFDSAEVLVPAIRLVGLPGIREETDPPDRRYVHLLLPAHAVLIAEGVGAESLWLGAEATRFLGAGVTARLQRLLPEARHHARPFAEGRRARRLIERHLRNTRALWIGPPPAAALAPKVRPFPIPYPDCPLAHPTADRHSAP